MAILVSALFLGSAASAGFVPNSTTTMNTTTPEIQDLQAVQSQSPLARANAPTGLFEKNEQLQVAVEEPTPLNPFEQLIYYHIGPATDAIGLTAGGTYQAAMRITPTEQSAYSGYSIVAVNWHHWEAGEHSGNIKVYAAGTASSPGAEIASIPYTVTGSGMKRIDLTSFIPLPITADIWVSVQITHTAGQYPIGIDSGPAVAGKGDWIEYGSGWQTLSGAGFNSNWVIETVIDMTTQYDHDVGVQEIVKPVSGPGSVMVPEVAVKNYGLNNETNVPVNLKITKYQYTTLLEEHFAPLGVFPPTGWTLTNTKWAQYNSANAGGTAPEARFYYSPSETGDFRLYTYAINTTGYTNLNLQFRHMVNHYTTPYTLKVETSTDAATWTTAWSINPTGSVPAQMVTVPLNTTHGVGSSTLYISWTFSGYSYNINYWYVDDCMIRLVAEILEYNQTVTISSIASGAVQNVLFPTWTPADYGVAENVDVDYMVEAETMLTGDNYTANDYKTQFVTLHFGYHHDIAVQNIVSPVSGDAQVFTPEVVVQNVGQNDETNVPIRLVISKPYFVENFDSTTFPPAGWTQEEYNEWRRVTTANAGGKSPEARLYYSYIVGNYAYLQSPAVDTTGNTELVIEFRSMIQNNYGGANCKVLMRGSSTGNWTDVTPWANPITANVAAAKYVLNASAFVGNATQVRFEFSGTSAGIMYWYLDNITMYQLDTTEYDHTLYVNVNAGDTLNLIYPDWTPSDLGIAENADILYTVLAESQLTLDNNSANDVVGKDIILHYPWMHDVAVTDIFSPVSGPAQTQPVKVAVANNGQNDESIFVNVVIEKFNATGEDFEASNGGYVSSGTGVGLWEWGTPTSGPGGAHSGSKLWATGLAGNYGGCDVKLDKAVTLPSGSVSLIFWHWYDTEASYDGGNVKISTDNGSTWTILMPEGGYTGTGNTANPLSGEPIFTGHVQKYWEKETINLNAYAGQSVIVRWHFGSDSSVHYPGWYIDDVLFADPSAFIPEYSDTVSVDLAVGETVNVTLADWTPSDMSLAVNIDYRVTATATIAGWNDVATETFDNYTAGYYNFPTGWTTQTTNPTGAWFMYVSGTTYIYARVQESGSDGNAQDEWLKSTAVDCSGLTNVHLIYRKYYYESTTSGDTYTQVLGSIDGGATWPYLITNYTASSTSSTPEDFDISAWAAGQANVKIAYRFVSTNDTGLLDYFYVDDFFVGTPWGPYGDNPPSGWTILNYGSETPNIWNSNDWHKYYTSTSYGAQQMNTARVYYSPYESMEEWLVTPTLNCGALSTVDLVFWQYFYYSTTYPGDGFIDGSIDGGVTWAYPIAHYNSTQSYSSAPYAYDISSWAAGQSNVKIRFRYNSTASHGYYWYLDDVYVGDGTTTVLMENFEGTGYWTHFADNFVPPSWGPFGWTPDTVHWSVYASSNAGGTAPELRFYYSPSITGVTRIYTAPIDTSAFTELGLQFKHYVNHYTTPYTLKVETSTDGATWNTVWEVSPTSNVGPEIVDLMLDASDGIGSSTFRLAFTFDGYTYNINYWYIDDVLLRSVSTTPDGNPGDNSMQSWITLTYAHDVGVSMIVEPIGPAETATLDWYSGDAVSGVSVGGTPFEGAIRFNETDLAGYVDWEINTVKFHKGYGTTVVPACSGQVKIYSGVNASTLETTQAWTVGEGSFWVTVPLSNPVKIDPATEYWISVYYASYDGYPAGADAGPAIVEKGDWVSWDGQPWAELYTFGIDRNWCMEAILNGPVADEWPPGTYPVSAVINNFGFTYPETGFDVNAKLIQLPDTVVYEENITVTTTLAPGEFVVEVFPDFTIENLSAWEGDYRLEIKTMLPNDDQTSNDKKTKTFTIVIPDVLPPVTEHTLSGTTGNDDWYRSDVTITLTATDPYPPFRFIVGKGPSGVDYTMIKIDDGEYENYTVPVKVSTDGTHEFWYYSVDNAGNIEEENGPFSFKIDKTGPVFNSYTFTAQNALKNKWLCVADVEDLTSGVVLVEFYVDDALVGNVTSAPWEFLFEGKPEASSQAIAYDAAGNSAMSEVASSVEYIPNSQSYYPRII